MPLSQEQIARMKALLAEPVPTPSNSTKSRKEERDEFEKRFGYKTPTADLVARIEAAERIVWVPCGYVLFVRKNTCRHCRTVERCLDVPQLFLQQRQARRDSSNPYLYTPVTSIEHWSLPRREVLRITTSPYCRACWEEAVYVERKGSVEEEKKNEGESTTGLREEVKDATQCEDSNSSQVVIELHTGSLDEFLPIHELQPKGESPLAAIASPSSPESASLWNTHLVASAGSPSETEFGSACGEREFGSNVTAEG